jgi:hypothetical protein
MGRLSGGLVDGGESDAPLPLTPALSVGEREEVIPLWAESKGFGLLDALPALLPLPGGEGRGEGEGTIEVSNASPSSPRNKNLGEASTGMIAWAMPSSKPFPGSR